MSAVIDRRKKRDKIRLAVCVREADMVACIEKMAVTPIFRPCIVAIYSNSWSMMAILGMIIAPLYQYRALTELNLYRALPLQGFTRS